MLARKRRYKSMPTPELGKILRASQQACIIGIGQTEFARWGGIIDRSAFRLAAQAILAAAADAGLPPDRIDGFASYSDDRSEPAVMHAALGTRQLRFASMVWGGGGGGACGAVAQAAAAVEAGMAEFVVAYRGLCQGQSFRFGQYHPWTPDSNFTAPYGLLSPPQMAALLMQRHMHEFGTTREQLGAIAMSAYDNASRNPHAVMRNKRLTLEDYLSARMIAEPLGLYDCCLESDGAAALIVTTWERAKDMRGVPIRILAYGQGAESGWGTGLLGSHNMPDRIYASANARLLAEDLYVKAGLTAQDIDTAQLYDAFTSTVLMALEDYGFCARGEAGAFVAEGHIACGGRLPINTSGGNLAEAYIHGFNLVLEGVRQMRGSSTSQVAEAATCLVCGGPSVTPTSAIILGNA